MISTTCELFNLLVNKEDVTSYEAKVHHIIEKDYRSFMHHCKECIGDESVKGVRLVLPTEDRDAKYVVER